MPEPKSSKPAASREGTIPLSITLPLAAILTLAFVALLFPWDALGRRLAYEIGRSSGAGIRLDTLAPALTERGPVLRASEVTIEHPAIGRLRVSPLEVAPRFGSSWLGGAPRLRIFAESEIGAIDGVLVLGSAPAFDGVVKQVAIERLPMRLTAAGVTVAGVLDADADVALAADGSLRGRIEFDSNRMRLQASLMPQPIDFSRASGTLAILENGATRLEGVTLEGGQLRGTLTGEIGLVHRSQPPPLDLRADLEFVDPALRALAVAAGMPVQPDGRAALQIRGTAALPIATAAEGAAPLAAPPSAAIPPAVSAAPQSAQPGLAPSERNGA